MATPVSASGKLMFRDIRRTFRRFWRDMEKKVFPQNRKVEIISQEIFDAWEVLCSVYRSRGIDLDKLLNEAAASKPEWLSRRRRKEDFDQLLKAGCSEVSLLIALWIIRSA